MGARLRQGVLVAGELEPVVAALRTTLGLAEPFRDPGVAAFGLHNAVCALGDTFLEVVSPTVPDTAAGRHLQRLGGDGGYMLLFQVDDLGAARERATEAGVRTVWQIDLPDIGATHLHPADLGGTIVSLDRPVPAGTWRWGGPLWTGRIGEGAPGRLTGAVVAVPDPDSVAHRWAQVLGVPLRGDGLELDGGSVRFIEGTQGLVELLVQSPRLGGETALLGGVRFSAG